jgi:hypothetical protein
MLRRGGDWPGFELILVDTHRGLFVRASHDHTFDNQGEPYAIIQKHRPIDGSLEDLPWREDFGSGKEQARAADIQALAENDTARVSTLNAAAFNRQPQGETRAAPTVGCVFHMGSPVFGHYQHYSHFS